MHIIDQVLSIKAQLKKVMNFLQLLSAFILLFIIGYLFIFKHSLCLTTSSHHIQSQLAASNHLRLLNTRQLPNERKTLTEQITRVSSEVRTKAIDNLINTASNLQQILKTLRENDAIQQKQISYIKANVKENGKAISILNQTLRQYKQNNKILQANSKPIVINHLPQTINNLTQNETIYDANSRYLYKFDVSGSTITIKQYDSNYYQLIGSIPIRQKKINQFTVQNSHQGYIYLGIIDNQYAKYANPWGQTNFILYLVRNGSIRIGNKFYNQSKQIDQGQTVVMEVNLDDGMITWKVENEILNSITNQMISDTSIKWMPVIILHNLNDKVTWK